MMINRNRYPCSQFALLLLVFAGIGHCVSSDSNLENLLHSPNTIVEVRAAPTPVQCAAVDAWERHTPRMVTARLAGFLPRLRESSAGCSAGILLPSAFVSWARLVIRDIAVLRANASNILTSPAPQCDPVFDQHCLGDGAVPTTDVRRTSADLVLSHASPELDLGYGARTLACA